jgi:hypothetical protein
MTLLQAALAKERISAWSGECRHAVKQQSDSDLKDKEGLALRV